MFRSQKKIIPTLILGLSLVGLNCSDSGTNSSSDAVMVTGKVEGNDSKQKIANVEGAVVTAATVTSNGTISTLEQTEVEADASGNFELSFDADAAQNFVIMAEDGESTWMAFLNAEVENGSNITLKPINGESTAETKVFAELIANGEFINTTKADIEAMVTSEAALAINASETAKSEFSAAISNSSDARTAFFNGEVEGDADAKLEATLENLREAQVDLEAALSSSTTVEGDNAAIAAFINARVDAYTDANVSANNAARSIEMETRMFLSNMSTISTDVQNSVRAKTSLMLAVAMDNAVRVEAEAAGMSETTMNNIEQAGTDLRASIEAALGIESSINTAFENFRDEVNTAMQEDGSFEASVFVNIDSEINAENGSKSIFESAIEAIANATLAVDIYEDFYLSVETTVENNVDSSTDENTIDALVNTMVLINLES